MTMNVMNVKNAPVNAAAPSSVSPKEGSAFSDILTGTVEKKLKEAETGVKNEKKPEEKQLEEALQIANEHVPLESEAHEDSLIASPFNLIPEKGPNTYASVEKTGKSVEELKPLEMTYPELTVSNTKNEEVLKKPENGLQNAIKTEAPEIQGKHEVDAEGTGSEKIDAVLKDFTAQLKEASGKTEKIDKSPGEILKSGAVEEEIADPQRRDTAERKEAYGDKPVYTAKADESLPSLKVLKGPDHNAVPYLDQNPEAIKEETLKPEKDMTLKAEENIAPMQDQKSSEGIKASGVKEQAAKPEFDQNLEKATNEILKSMETLRDGDKTTMKLKLHPEELGKMEITLTMEEGKLSGKILLDNHEARQLFNQKIDELNETLGKSSIQMAKFEVGIGDRQTGSQGRQQENRQSQNLNPFKGYFSQSKNEISYGRNVHNTLDGIDLLA